MEFAPVPRRNAGKAIAERRRRSRRQRYISAAVAVAASRYIARRNYGTSITGHGAPMTPPKRRDPDGKERRRNGFRRSRARLIPRRKEKGRKRENGREKKRAINRAVLCRTSSPLGGSHAVLLQTAAALRAAEERTERADGRKISTLLCARGEFRDKNAPEDLCSGETSATSISPSPSGEKRGRWERTGQCNEDEVHAQRA